MCHPCWRRRSNARNAAASVVGAGGLAAAGCTGAEAGSSAPAAKADGARGSREPEGCCAPRGGQPRGGAPRDAAHGGLAVLPVVPTPCPGPGTARCLLAGAADACWGCGWAARPAPELAWCAALLRSRRPCWVQPAAAPAAGSAGAGSAATKLRVAGLPPPEGAPATACPPLPPPLPPPPAWPAGWAGRLWQLPNAGAAGGKGWEGWGGSEWCRVAAGVLASSAEKSISARSWSKMSGLLPTFPAAAAACRPWPCCCGASSGAGAAATATGASACCAGTPEGIGSRGEGSCCFAAAIGGG